jgi:hypothetical protein
MITLLFIALAGLFKSVADTIQHHYYDSYFQRFNQRFWNPALSWKYVKTVPFTKYRPDAWHLSNSLMVISFCLAAVLNDLYWHWVLQLVVAGLVFNIVFNTFYNRIWR